MGFLVILSDGEIFLPQNQSSQKSIKENRKILNYLDKDSKEGSNPKN